MCRTDDPIADFHRHEQDVRDWMRRRPVCCECDQPIQGERLCEFEGENICLDCLKENHLKFTEDFEL
jgi:hypothetical protein